MANTKVKQSMLEGVYARSEVYVDNGNGNGSTNTRVRRYSNIRKNVGTAITYADSATLGASFTINEDGIYSVDCGDYDNGTTIYFGIVINGTSLSTNMSSQTYATGKRAGANSPATQQQVASWTGFLSAGDVIRTLNNGAGANSDAFVWCNVAQVSK